MNSPFPGMDPYLEQHWRDVHQSLVIYARDQLQPNLPDDLKARVEERVFVEADRYERNIYPDVRIFEKPRRSANPRRAKSGVAVAEPWRIRVPAEAANEGFIEIRDVANGNRVITVVEILSPANKLPGEGRELYLRKQQELESGGVSLVEIDLLRSGERVTRVPAGSVPQLEQTSYVVTVRRGSDPEIREVYPLSLRERLPVIAIPLRQDEDDAPLDLQELIDLAYRNGAYDDLDYRRDPNPPLDPADAAWADALLRERGLR